MSKQDFDRSPRLCIQGRPIVYTLIVSAIMLCPEMGEAAPQDDRIPAPPSPLQRTTRNQPRQTESSRTPQPLPGNQFQVSPNENQLYPRQVVRPVTERMTRMVPVVTTRLQKDPKTGQMKPVTETSYREEQSTVTRYVTEFQYAKMPHVERIKELSQELTGSDVFSDEESGEVSAKRDELKDLLGDQFDVMHEEQQKQIDQLEKRLKRLQTLQKMRGDARDEIIERRMKSLTRQPDPYAWNPQTPPTPFQPTPFQPSPFQPTTPYGNPQSGQPNSPPGATWAPVPGQNTNPLPAEPPRLQYRPAPQVPPSYPSQPPRAPQTGQLYLLDTPNSTQDRTIRKRRIRSSDSDFNGDERRKDIEETECESRFDDGDSREQ